MPLSKDALWQRYVEKNPHWLTDGVKLTPEGLKRFFDQTFEMGHRLGVENGKALAEPKRPKDDHSSLFDRVFGKL